MSNDFDWVTPKQLAATLGVPVWRVWYQIKKEQIPFCRRQTAKTRYLVHSDQVLPERLTTYGHKRCEDDLAWIPLNELAKKHKVTRHRIYFLIRSNLIQWKKIGRLLFVRRDSVLCPPERGKNKPNA